MNDFKYTIINLEGKSSIKECTMKELSASSKDDLDILKGYYGGCVYFIAPKHWFNNRNEFAQSIYKTKTFEEYLEECKIDCLEFIKSYNELIESFGSKEKLNKYLSLHDKTIKDILGEAFNSQEELSRCNMEGLHNPLLVKDCIPNNIKNSIFANISVIYTYAEILSSYKQQNNILSCKFSMDDDITDEDNRFLVVNNLQNVDALCVIGVRNEKEYRLLVDNFDTLPMYSIMIDTTNLKNLSHLIYTGDNLNKNIQDVIDSVIERVENIWES